MNKFQDARQRYASPPTAKTNYDPDWKKKGDFQSNASSDGPRSGMAPPRPPPSRAGAPRPDSEGTADQGEELVIDWANLSPEDKQVFFSWLDEFFARYLNNGIPRNTTNMVKPVAPPLSARASASGPPPPPDRGPPVSCHLCLTAEYFRSHFRFISPRSMSDPSHQCRRPYLLPAVSGSSTMTHCHPHI